MVPFESFGMVSYSHSVATMTISLAVSTQHTNVTDRQTDRREAKSGLLVMIWPENMCYQSVSMYCKRRHVVGTMERR